MEGIQIRAAERGDCPAICELIQELADYEKMPDGPKIDAKTLEEDGFGECPFYKCFVAVDKKLIGYVLFFRSFSTKYGKGVYMEDLYVNPSYRHRGIGTALWKRVAQYGLENDLNVLNFSVLDWNAPSIAFYKSKGAVDQTEEDGICCLRLTHEAMKKLVS
ncbi:thialysine N-epsilon-acetyltransferase-like [Oratosquilla oratoria]|uniref:thialysine N-epsilon-acetyltransferase-like n=1 Tax=Oratosquilla oratoria TaxID=337810 RepID=UPI003F75E586